MISLQPLIQALLSQLPAESSAIISVKTDAASGPQNGQRTLPDGPIYDPSVVFLLELCTILTLKSEETITTLGGAVAEALQNIVRDARSHHPTTVSRTVYYLFSLLSASFQHSYIRVPVVLHAISSFKSELLSKCGPIVLKGVRLCILTPGPLRNEVITSPDFWSILRSLSAVKATTSLVFELLESVVVGEQSLAIMADNYEAAISLLNDFASQGSVGAVHEQRRDKAARGKAAKQMKPVEDPIVARGTRAIALIYDITARIPALMLRSHLESREAWTAYWTPVFGALTTQCTNPCREIRHQAFSALQRTLVSKPLTTGDHDAWTAIFDEVLFPLITRLLKPEVYSTDPVGMSETRVQAATLLCRIFLHHLVQLTKWDGMLDLWLRILDIMDRLMNSGQGDSLVSYVDELFKMLLMHEQEEAVPESLKNILLVMSSSGYLTPPTQDATNEKLWVETWKRLDRFLPELRRELQLDNVPAKLATEAPEESDEYLSQKVGS